MHLGFQIHIEQYVRKIMLMHIFDWFHRRVIFQRNAISDSFVK